MFTSEGFLQLEQVLIAAATEVTAAAEEVAAIVLYFVKVFDTHSTQFTIQMRNIN